MSMECRHITRRSLQASQECVWHDKNTRNNDACVCAHMCEGTATQPTARQQSQSLVPMAVIVFAFESFVHLWEERHNWRH